MNRGFLRFIGGITFEHGIPKGAKVVPHYACLLLIWVEKGGVVSNALWWHCLLRLVEGKQLHEVLLHKLKLLGFLKALLSDSGVLSLIGD